MFNCSLCCDSLAMCNWKSEPVSWTENFHLNTIKLKLILHFLTHEKKLKEIVYGYKGGIVEWERKIKINEIFFNFVLLCCFASVYEFQVTYSSYLCLIPFVITFLSCEWYEYIMIIVVIHKSIEILSFFLLKIEL
jgi:hypothetical protein